MSSPNRSGASHRGPRELLSSAIQQATSGRGSSSASGSNSRGRGGSRMAADDLLARMPRGSPALAGVKRSGPPGSLAGTGGNARNPIGTRNLTGGGGIGKRQRAQPDDSKAAGGGSAKRPSSIGSRPGISAVKRGGSTRAPSRPSPPKHIAIMNDWVKSRFKGPGIVDLSGMGDDPVLKENQIYPPGHSLSLPQTGDVLIKMIAAEDVHVHTLSLASNNLSSLKQFSNLGITLPHLRALDLSNNPELRTPLHLNELSTTSRVSTSGGFTRAASCRLLGELVLFGCGIRTDAERRGKLDDYVKEMTARFPNLTMLDGQVVPRIVFDIPSNTVPKPIGESQFESLRAQPLQWPAPIKPSYLESSQVGEFVNAFMARFFHLFDNDRNQLLPAYAPNATASLSHATAVPTRSRVANYHRTLPNQEKLNWNKWQNASSRNLVKISSTARANTVVINKGDALRVWLSETLPKTSHPLEEPDKWIYDAIELDALDGMGRVLLTVHGEFREYPAEGLRSFTRVFVLGQAPPNSPVIQAGWSAIILSDSLAVRGYCHHKSFSQHLKGAVPPSAPAHDNIAADIAAIPNLTPEQKNIVGLIQSQTNLNTQWALQCAEAAGYQLENALAVFQQQQASGGIPPECFRT